MVISIAIHLQAALKKSNLELEAELKVKLNNIEMLNEAAQMKDKIIKVTFAALLKLLSVMGFLVCRR